MGFCSTSSSVRSRVRSKEPSGETFEFSIEKMEADRMDLGAFAHIFDPEAYRRRPWRQYLAAAHVARRLRQDDRQAAATVATFSVDEIAVENIDGRQPEKPFTEMWDRLMDPEIPQDVEERSRHRGNDTMFCGLAGRNDPGRRRLCRRRRRTSVSFSLSSASR